MAKCFAHFSRSNGKGMRETEDFFGPVSLVAEATMKAEQPFDQV